MNSKIYCFKGVSDSAHQFAIGFPLTGFPFSVLHRLSSPDSLPHGLELKNSFKERSKGDQYGKLTVRHHVFRKCVSPNQTSNLNSFVSLILILYLFFLRRVENSNAPEEEHSWFVVLYCQAQSQRDTLKLDPEARTVKRGRRN